jgi:hypothetical protein
MLTSPVVDARARNRESYTHRCEQLNPTHRIVYRLRIIRVSAARRAPRAGRGTTGTAGAES